MTFAGALAAATLRLERAGCSTPRLDAEILLCHAGGLSRAALIVRRPEPLDDALALSFDALIARRERREPVAYLISSREFFSLSLQVDASVLVPRPETERLVEVAVQIAIKMSARPRASAASSPGLGGEAKLKPATLPGAAAPERPTSDVGSLIAGPLPPGGAKAAPERPTSDVGSLIAGPLPPGGAKAAPERPTSDVGSLIAAALPPGGEAAAHALRIVDVCTGSGAVALALEAELRRHGCPARIVGSDLSAAALGVARRNVREYGSGVVLLRADLLAALRPGGVDLIVANPPYLSEIDLDEAAPELKWEPEMALCGGNGDGLGVIGALLGAALKSLAPGGWLVFEIGARQGAASLDWARGLGFVEGRIERDLEDRDRVVVCRRAER